MCNLKKQSLFISFINDSQIQNPSGPTSYIPWHLMSICVYVVQHIHDLSLHEVGCTFYATSLSQFGYNESIQMYTVNMEITLQIKS